MTLRAPPVRAGNSLRSSGLLPLTEGGEAWGDWRTELVLGRRAAV